MNLAINSFDQTSKTVQEFFLKNSPCLYMQIGHLCTLTGSWGDMIFLFAHTAFHLHKRYIHRQGGVSSQLKQIELPHIFV